MDIITIYERQQEKLRSLKEKGKEKGQGTYLKLEESIKSLMEHLRKKQEQREQIDQEIQELEKDLKENQEEKGYK